MAFEVSKQKEVSSYVKIEQELLPNRQDRYVNGICSLLDKIFSDVRIMHPNVLSYRDKKIL